MSFKILTGAAGFHFHVPTPAPHEVGNDLLISSWELSKWKSIMIIQKMCQYEKWMYKFGAFPVFFSFSPTFFLVFFFFFSIQKHCFSITRKLKFTCMSFTPWTNCICTRAQLHKFLDDFSPLLSLTVKSETQHIWFSSLQQGNSRVLCFP